MEDDAEVEYDDVYVESTIGWGGMIIGPDGVGRPMPEVDALLMAIPGWVGDPQLLDQAVRIYIEVMQRSEAAVRVAAATAIGEVARRYGQIPHHADAIAIIRRARQDPDVRVRQIAHATLLALEELPG